MSSWWLCPRTDEGSWLGVGWKSNVNQEEVTVEFIEDLERADTDRVSGRLRKERRVSLIFTWGLGFLNQRWWSGVCIHSGIQEIGETRMNAQVSSKRYILEPGVLMSGCLESVVLANIHEWLSWSLLRFSLLC